MNLATKMIQPENSSESQRIMELEYKIEHILSQLKEIKKAIVESVYTKFNQE